MDVIFGLFLFRWVHEGIYWVACRFFGIELNAKNHHFGGLYVQLSQSDSSVKKIIAAWLAPIGLYVIIVAIGARVLSMTTVATSVVSEVVPDSPAENASIQPGDRIVTIENEGIDGFDDIVDAVQRNDGSALSIQIERNNEVRLVQVVPEISPDDGRPRIGIRPTLEAAAVFPDAFYFPYVMLDGLVRSVTAGFNEPNRHLAGAVRLVDAVSRKPTSAALIVLYLTVRGASAALAIQVLPFPGTVLFRSFAALRRRRLQAE